MRLVVFTSAVTCNANLIKTERVGLFYRNIIPG